MYYFHVLFIFLIFFVFLIIFEHYEYNKNCFVKERIV